MAKYNMSGYDMSQINILYKSDLRTIKDMEVFGETDTDEYTALKKGVEVYYDLIIGNISDYEFRNRMKAISTDKMDNSSSEYNHLKDENKRLQEENNKLKLKAENERLKEENIKLKNNLYP